MMRTVSPLAILVGVGFVLAAGAAQAQSIIPVIGETPTTGGGADGGTSGGGVVGGIDGGSTGGGGGSVGGGGTSGGGVTQVLVEAARQETVQVDALLAPAVNLTVSATQRAIATAVSRIRFAARTNLAGYTDVQYAALDQEGPLLAEQPGKPFGGWTFAAWGNIQNSWAESTAANAGWDGTITMPLFGFDATSDEWLGFPLVLGLSAGYQHTSLSTAYNAGSLIGDGASISPYFALVPSDYFYIDGSVGYTRTGYDLESHSSGAAALSSMDGDRLSAFVFLNGTMPNEWHGTDGLTIGGKVGFTYATEYFSGYTDSLGTSHDDSRSELGQVSVGGSVRYLVDAGGFAFEPYFEAVFSYDAIRSGGDTPGLSESSGDRTDVVLAFGADLLVSDNFTITAEYNTTLARDDYSNHTGLLLARAKF